MTTGPLTQTLPSSPAQLFRPGWILPLAASLDFRAPGLGRRGWRGVLPGVRWQCQHLGCTSQAAPPALLLALPWLPAAASMACKPCRGTLCLPSSGELSGRGDERKNSWMTWKPSPVLAAQSRWRWGCSAVFGWDGFLLQALCAVPNLHSLLSLDI